MGWSRLEGVVRFWILPYRSVVLSFVSICNILLVPIPAITTVSHFLFLLINGIKPSPSSTCTLPLTPASSTSSLAPICGGSQSYARVVKSGMKELPMWPYNPNARLQQTLSLIMFDVLLWILIPKYSPCMAKAETSIAHTFEQCWLRPTDNKPWSHPISAMIQDCGTKLAIVLSLPTRKLDIIFGFNDALDQIDYPCSMIQSLSRTNPLQLCTQAKRWHTWSVDRPRVLLFYDHKYSIEEASSVKKTGKSCPLQWCRMKH